MVPPIKPDAKKVCIPPEHRPKSPASATSDDAEGKSTERRNAISSRNCLLLFIVEDL